MTHRFSTTPIWASSLITLTLGIPEAWSQVAPAPAPAAPPPAAEPAPAEPPAAPAPPPAETPPAEAQVAAETPPAEAPQPDAPPPDEVPTDTVAPDETEEKKYKALDYAIWARVWGGFNNGNDLADPAIDDQSANADVEFHFFGQVHEYIKFTANLVASFGNGNIAGNASLLDGIVQFEFHDLVNIWAGRMLVPSDRSNFSGPWFMAPWFYPGFYANGLVVAPRQGPFGRNDGITYWGQVGGGLFKFYASVFDLYDVNTSPLYSGRLNLSLLNPEPGFYHSSTYYGKDILAIGVSVQAKNEGSVGVPPPPAMPGDPIPPAPTDDYFGFSADLLFEKDLAEAGVLDVEGAYYNFQGDFEPVEQGWFALASYLLPGEVGIGKLQPLVRVQQAIPSDSSIDPSTMIDGQLGYVIDAYAARLALGYQHGILNGGVLAPDVTAHSNSIYLGAQIEK